jgi:hypothetical protein
VLPPTYLSTHPRFHVDNHSSAHVYLRLPKGMTIDTIHPATLEECFQLVKVCVVPAKQSHFCHQSSFLNPDAYPGSICPRRVPSRSPLFACWLGQLH